MHKKYDLLGMVLVIACFLSGCGLLDVQEQHEKIASYCQIYGTVKPEIDNGKKLVVALFKFNGGDIKNRGNWSLFDHFVNDQPGQWYFSTASGKYLVAAFKDVNSDLIYQLDEPALAPVPENMIDCQPGGRKNRHQPADTRARPYQSRSALGHFKAANSQLQATTRYFARPGDSDWRSGQFGSTPFCR